MTWELKTATQRGDTIEVVFSEGDRLHTVRHYRTSFGGVPQTLTEWRTNVKREVKALLDTWNAAPPEDVDVLRSVR